MKTKLLRKKPRGFAGMDPERQREVARKGGGSVPPEKRSFATNPEFAKKAGQKGGFALPAEKRSFSTNRALASEAGKRGVAKRKANLAKASQSHES